MNVRGMPPFGLLAEKTKDRNYILGLDGFIFTSPYVVTPNTARSAAAILLTIDSPSFMIGKGDGMSRTSGALVGSRVERSLQAVDVKLISINVAPSHPSFHILVKAAQNRIVSIPRDIYDKYDDELEGLYAGTLGTQEVRALFEEITSSVSLFVGGVVDRRPYRQEILSLITACPDITLSELSAKLGVSYATASRFFCDAIGMPLRSFQHSYRLHTCWNAFSSAQSLTQIAYDTGFADSAHFTRAWRHAYGMPPSYVFKGDACDLVYIDSIPLRILEKVTYALSTELRERNLTS